jgi:solute carrier family 34 (sodium-dependent phosphate cotransporter)
MSSSGTTDQPSATDSPAAVIDNGSDPSREAAPGLLEAGYAGRRGSRRWLRVASKALYFAAAIFLFILAIQLMKKGAAAIGPRIEGTFPFDNGVSTLGLGWLGAYFVLSGSPVAATALTFYSEGTLTPLQTFTMLSGSRLGAAFIVLVVGFVYAMRSRNRETSIGMGVLALSMTAIVYVPGMLIGYGLLKSGVLSGIDWQASSDLLSVIDLIWGPLQRAVQAVVPDALLFPVGLAVILLSFRLLDRVLPSLDGERHTSSRGHWLKRPWPMFGLGMLAALLTLSVSVALTVLVPLASRGYVKREEAIPYIAGANITTLADTLVAAMLLGRATGVQIVLAEAIGVSLVTLFFLAFLYRPVSRRVIALDDWVVGSKRRLWLFVIGLFVLPLVLMTSGFIIGPITR